MAQKHYENRDFDGKNIRQRISDGYISATDMCTINKKRIADWNLLHSTKEFLQELSKDTNIPISELLEIKKGGHSQGTWIHPRIATYLAQWISPKFSVKVSKWIEEWKLSSLKNKEAYINEIENLEPSKCVQKEKQLQEIYKQKLKAAAEVETRAGYIDLLTEDSLIEIKIASNWKHGVGQLICYGNFYPNHKKWLYLFDHEEYDNLDLIESICSKNSISIKLI